MVVIGDAGLLSKQITCSFLSLNATVALLAGSTQEINEHYYKSKNTASEKFIYFLTDPFDYIKCLDILSDLRETFGGIDLVVTTLENFCPQLDFTNVKLFDWHSVTEHNIKFFLTNRLILTYLKDETSLYVTVGKKHPMCSDNQNTIADLTATQRLKAVEIISSEFTDIKARYHHLLVDTENSGEQSNNCYGKKAADYIIQLYLSDVKKKDSAIKGSVFHNLENYISPL